MDTFGVTHVRTAMLAMFAAAGVLLFMMVLDARAQREVAVNAPVTQPATMTRPPLASTTAEVAPAPRARAQLAGFTRHAPAARAGTADRWQPEMAVNVTRNLDVRSTPGGGKVIGRVPARSSYLGTPMRAWVLQRSPDGRFGKVVLPWSGSSRTGWISLRGMKVATTSYVVRISLSKRQLVVTHRGRAVLRVPTAIGASQSPSPTGLFYVTDRVAVPASQPQFGSFAFGLSGIQPNTPPGWTGGNQMAIHGTNAPGSIGTPASAGCLRVSERTLARLRPVLRLGTPVVIER